MLQVALQRSLGGIREETSSETEHNLSSNDTGAAIRRRHASVVDKKTKRDHPDASSCNNEHLKSSDLVDNQTENSASNDTDEGVERGDTSGSLDAEVEGHNQDSVEVVTLHGPGKVEEQSNAHGSPDRSILHQLERNQRVRGTHLPEDEGRDAEHTDDERRDNVGLAPLGIEATGKSKRHKNKGEDSDEQNDTNDVKEPEQLNGEVLVAEGLEGGSVVVEVALLLGATRDVPEADDKRKGAHRVDDAPHANTPVPGGGLEDSLGDVTTGPGVNNEGSGRDVAEEETGAGRGDVGDDDLDQQDDHGVANLVDDTSSAEGLDVGGDGLDHGANHIEEDGQADELDTAEDVSNLGRGRLRGGSNHGAQDIDGGKQRVLLEVGGSGWLVGVAQGAVETVDVGDKEDTEEDEDTINKGNGLAQTLDTDDTRRLHIPDSIRRSSRCGFGGHVDGLRLLSQLRPHSVRHDGDLKALVVLAKLEAAREEGRGQPALKLPSHEMTKKLATECPSFPHEDKLTPKR